MEWRRGDVVGRGSTATVSVAMSGNTGRVFAVKSAELSRSEPLRKEARILSSLDSPHVVKYIGSNVTTEGNDEIVYNVMIEYVPGGTVSDAVSAGKGLREAMIRRYTRKIAEGLSYLHSRGVVHCDIKGRNILLAGDGPKIADFGCAKTSDAAEKGVGGTPMFMAPEAVRGDSQGPESDIWSLGCTVIEMSGLSPWPNSGDHVSVLYRLACTEASPEIPKFLSEEARDFLSKCLRRSPEERWTAEQLLTHPFLSGADSEPDFARSVSPTSVLDDPFSRVWGSVSEAGVSGFRDGDSATERIGRLATEESDWRLEGDDWITIRGDYDHNKHDYGRLIRNYGELACGEDNLRSLVSFQGKGTRLCFPIYLGNNYYS